MKFEELLEYRNMKKAKQPVFLRQDAHKLKTMDEKWRQPKGMHSKIRKKLRGYRKQPSVGYSSPRLVKGLDKLGNKIIIINNLSSLKDVSTPVILSSALGLKKKIQILKLCLEKKIQVLNVKDVHSFIKNVEENIQKRKLSKAKKEEHKQKSKEESLKKAKEKKKEETEEEKIAREKEEKRAVLEGGQ